MTRTLWILGVGSVVVLMGTLGLVSVVRAALPSAAVEPEPARTWGGTSLNSRLVVAPELGGRIEQGAAYSPSGQFVVMRAESSALVLDLESSQVTSVHALMEDVALNRECIAAAWLADDRVYILDQFSSSGDLSTAEISYRSRVVLWATGVVLEEQFFEEFPPFVVVGGESATRWLVMKAGERERVWLYDAPSREFLCVWMECGSDQRYMRKPQQDWAVIGPRKIKSGIDPVDIDFRNAETGESRSVRSLPANRGEGPMLVQSRWVVASTYRMATGRTAPLVVDTTTGEARELPETESWAPIDISQERGMLLVCMSTRNPDETWTIWFEEMPIGEILAAN